MEPTHTQPVNGYPFLYDKQAPKFFAQADYLLRSGVHLQLDHPDAGLYRFINRSWDEGMPEYYKDLFNLKLSRSGSELNRYYYLDLDEDQRYKIPAHHRDTLGTQEVIIGMLFFKLYKLEGNIDLDKVSDFTSLLFSEYEEEKEGLRILIGDSGSPKGTDYSDEKINDAIRKAFKQFNELGWIAWENEIIKDRFRYMPSFERLRDLYQQQILGIDELIKTAQDGR
jgi:hypothetical protein